MNSQPPSFSDEDEPLEPAPQTPKTPRQKTSRAEVLGWCAALFGFAAIASVLLLPSAHLGWRLAWSAACLLLGIAFFVAALRQVD